jgi:hypothetical protein
MAKTARTPETVARLRRHADRVENLAARERAEAKRFRREWLPHADLN